METSLHRQLKQAYVTDGAKTEVQLGRYRIDVMADDRLVEIQHGTLAAIRDKIRQLLHSHRVCVVKPIVVHKYLIKQDARGGRVLQRRLSPKRGQILDVFDDLVHFTRVFPHPNLVIDVPLVDIEEWRFPGHGRRRRWRPRDHQIEDQKLLNVTQTVSLRNLRDLTQLISGRLPRPFHTGDLARAADVPRQDAQRIAYCLREMGAARQVGKQGNALLYELTSRSSRRKTRVA